MLGLKRRAETLEKMDKYLRRKVDDEEIFFEVWLRYGVPDGATKEDYESIAEDGEMYTDCLEAFVKTLLLDDM